MWCSCVFQKAGLITHCLDRTPALLKAAVRLDKTVTHSQNVYFKFSVKVRYMSVINTHCATTCTPGTCAWSASPRL